MSSEQRDPSGVDRFDFDGTGSVWMDRHEWNSELRQAIRRVLPPGVTFLFKHEDDGRVLFAVSKPADSQTVYEAALRAKSS